ncbi:MAG: serine/threonine-protein kinase, partial [Candidatus Dormibacteria bacterium]
MLNVGRFQVLAEIGHGASGRVFLGRQPDLDRAVAIKQLAPALAENQAFLGRFREEAQVMSRLAHPNCVKVYDYVETEDGAFLICEYIDGSSLRDVVNQAKRLSPEQSLGVLKGALSGLGYAHGLGLVHRDVKPENILADRAGTSKLADFGLAVFGSGVAEEGEIAGTPVYMSPEQARRDPLDHRSDIYSCGVVLFEFLSGRRPYEAPSSVALMSMHVQGPVPDPRKYNKKLSAGLAEMTMRAMAKDPAERQQSAPEFVAELEAHAADAYGEDWESRSKIKALVAGVAVGAALLAALGAGEVTADAAVQVGTASTGTAGTAGSTAAQGGAGAGGAGGAGGGAGAGGAGGSGAGAGGGGSGAGSGGAGAGGSGAMDYEVGRVAGDAVPVTGAKPPGVMAPVGSDGGGLGDSGNPIPVNKPIVPLNS